MDIKEAWNILNPIIDRPKGSPFIISQDIIKLAIYINAIKEKEEDAIAFKLRWS